MNLETTEAQRHRDRRQGGDRFVESELLDELPSDDPRAVQSRRDLKRVNFWMGNARIIAGALRKNWTGNPPKRIVELGAGDGTLLLAIAKGLPKWRGIEVVFVDQQDLISEQTHDEFNSLGWLSRNVKSDVFEWLGQGEKSDCVMANLFLHHFDSPKLKALFETVAAQTKLFVACEPKRTLFAPVGRELLRLIGCNDVTRHDGEISIRAGFRGSELSELWPKDGNWKLEERSAGLFSHLFVARRI